MGLISKISDRAKKYFPNLQVKYKNESLFMKILSTILFFNPDFKNRFTTTIGHTIYLPNSDEAPKNDKSYAMVILHELVHVHDYNFMFSYLYLFPQILFLLALPLLLVSWKISLIALIFLLPIPAYFRMKYEKRGYTISIYALKVFMDKGLISINKESFIEASKSMSKNFTTSAYYFMWPFSSIEKHFETCANEIYDGKKPFLEQDVYDMIDDVVNF